MQGVIGPVSLPAFYCLLDIPFLLDSFVGAYVLVFVFPSLFSSFFSSIDVFQKVLPMQGVIGPVSLPAFYCLLYIPFLLDSFVGAYVLVFVFPSLLFSFLFFSSIDVFQKVIPIQGVTGPVSLPAFYCLLDIPFLLDSFVMLNFLHDQCNCSYPFFSMYF